MKEKYNTPKCDCGNELIMYQEEAFSIEHKITKDGRVSKLKSSYSLIDGNYRRLRCNECSKEYNYKIVNEQIFKGDEW